MPWEIRRRGEDHCVVVSEGPKKGKVVKCHPTAEKARAHVRALYANTKEGHGGSGTHSEGGY